MKKIPCQLNDKGQFVPFGLEAIEEAREYKPNQLVTCKITGMSAKKERSTIALNLLMACCETVAENTEDQHWNTKEKVKFQVKVAINYIDASRTIVDPAGNVHLHYRSWSFDELPHMESVKVFDQAYPILAKKIGLNVDELIANTKAQMRSYK